MTRRRAKPPRPCHRCNQPSDRLYRVVVEPGGPWVFVCDTCWPVVSDGNPHYRYGGTWSSRPR